MGKGCTKMGVCGKNPDVADENIRSLQHVTLFGIKDIRLGPSLPAFITPAVLNVLVKNFNIMPISTPEQDLKAILG
jgi:hydroxylamine reductase (hybrid-cluster protein)